MAPDPIAAEGNGGYSATEFAPAQRLAADRPRLRREFWHKIRRLASRLPFAEDLLAAYYCAFDRRTPLHVQASLLGALAYFVLPFDFIPDLLPVLGFTDDAAVIATAIRIVTGAIKPEHREKAAATLSRLRAHPDAPLPEETEKTG